MSPAGEARTLANMAVQRFAADLSAQVTPPRRLGGPLWELVGRPLSATPRGLLLCRAIEASPHDRAALMELRAHLSVLLATDTRLCRQTEALLRVPIPQADLRHPEPPPSLPGPTEPVSDTRVHLDGRPTAPGPPVPSRRLQARLEPDDADRPALVTLAVGVGTTGAGVTFDDRSVFATGEEEVVLDVIVTTRDFAVLDGTARRLWLPRTGSSRNLARFDLIVPDDATEGEVTALLYKAGNLVAGMRIRLIVTPGERRVGEVSSIGRSLAAAPALRTRQLSLVIRPDRDGYTLTSFGAIRAEATLRLTGEHLRRLLAEARTALARLVDLEQYQNGVRIDEQLSRQSLAVLAEAGLRLYRAVFYDGDVAAEDFANRLRTVAALQNLKIQVVSDQFILPWGLLYLAEDLDHVDPECFLGFRHVIEHLLLRSTADVPVELSTSPRISVACAYDLGIDAEFQVGAVAGQMAYWEELRRANAGTTNLVELSTASTAAQVREALDGDGEPHIWYFYCHAVVDEAGVDGYLGLSDQSQLTLRELSVSPRRPLRGAPLVMINACGSATLGPLFYAGFLRYFIARGARGMIGTECDVPAEFAAEWAHRFFETFLRGGRTVGETLLDLRRGFLYEDRNPLGLMYALYCDADTTVVPGVQVMERR
ncbi:CHAT domain-containing protein [Actinoplanes sp. NPDC051861]|uniref:CHAT domain-containing protein n=1 Tax=Actinoplanes sp. NPDC051861 TaxID=3155170 RepID=UPI00342935D0